MYTNSTRITGLSGSGIDTDSMIEKLMYAESSKLYRYQRSVTWKTWQQEAYRNVITKFQDFQNKWLSSVGTSTSLKYSTAFASFKNSVKSSKGGDSDAITVNKSTSSQKYEIQVKELAQSDTYVSSSKAGKKIESEVNIDLGALAGKLKSDGMSFSVALDGKAKTITLDSADFAGVDFDSMSNADKASAIETVMNNKLTKAFGTENGGKSKVSVSLDQNGKFSVNQNLGHEISIGGAGVSTESRVVAASNADSLKTCSGTFMVTIDGENYTVTVPKSEASAGSTDEDTPSLATKINSALSKAVDSNGKEVDISGYLSAETDESNNLILSTGSSDVEMSNGTGTLSGVITNRTIKSSNDLKNYFNIASATTKVTNTSTLGEIFDSGIWDGDGKASITVNDKTIELSKYDNLATFLQNINSSDAGVNVKYNSTSQSFTFESSESGAVNEINFGTDAKTNSVLTAMGFDVSTMKTDTKQHTQTARDAVLLIDGVETTRTSNDIDLEGMNITLNRVTEAGEKITVGNETDVDAIYETVSKFVEEYNTLIGDLNKQVKETRAKSDDYTYYEPLTDQEKKEMDEDEIKLWEEKAKTGLLYRDSTITGVLSKMRSAIYTPVTKVDGTKVALYDFGITTSSSYTDNGKLVIDEEKLKDAIKNNLEDIQAIFTGNGTESGKGLAENLEDVINSAIGTKGTLREKAGIAGTASVNENTLSKQIKELNEKVSKEKERLVEKEQRYYLMFSNMESSIMNSNSQLDALFSMLGQ